MSNIFENEKHMIDSFLDLEKNIETVKEYIKENYNVESEYDADDNMLYIWTENINESLGLASAKEHVLNTIGAEMIDVIYGMKQ